MEERQLMIFNEDGTIKSKEDFIEEATQLYDECIEHSCDCIEETTFFDLVTSPELQTDTENAFNNFKYYERNIYIEGEITSEMATSIFSKIRFYNRMDELDEVPLNIRIPIRIFINTCGGELDAAFSIISSIKTSSTPIYTYNIGRAWSAGFFILISGNKRFGLPYTSYLYHEGSCGNVADAHKFINYTDFYICQLKQLKSIVLSNTEITEEDYEAHRKDDWWFTADEAYLYDVIDEVVEDFNEVEV